MALGVAKGSGERTLIIAFNTVKSGGFNYSALLIVIFTLAFKFNFTRILKVLKIKAYIPASFGALLFGTTVSEIFSLDVKTIGEIPRNVASFSAPVFTDFLNLLWPALMIALLAAIESLLSARVADSMAHTSNAKRLEPDQELFGQGIATAIACLLYTSDAADD